MPCTVSTSIALRSDASRMPACASARSRGCASRLGINSSTNAASGTSTSHCPMNQNTTQNSTKNGRSATAAMVVEVSMSRTGSSSRICEMKLPVERGRALLRTRSAWPNTRSEMRRSARLPSTSVMRMRALRITQAKAIDSSTPPNSTYSVGIDCAGITRS